MKAAVDMKPTLNIKSEKVDGKLTFSLPAEVCSALQALPIGFTGFRYNAV